MLFNSLPFLIFFPVVTISYFLCPHRFRWVLLLAASCVFYMFFIPQYLLILFALILIDYSMGILIEKARLKGVNARRYLVVSILATCAVWLIFKYFNFFSANLSALAAFLGLNLPAKIINLVVPIGLSFHTLQSLSYVVEVYKGRYSAERHLGIYALYVMFYPQLLAGPIERPQKLIPQLREYHHVEYQRIADALKLMAWGMFKKVVIADRLSVFVNQVFADVHSYQGPGLAAAVVFFAVQDYCDFSGYCDIAIGSAKAMGFRLTNNFNAPFFSKSAAEFFMRWNITFFSWVRDYIYAPLCHSRWLNCNRAAAVLLALIFSGFWHGANWTFVVSFEIFGIFVIISRLTRRIRAGVYDSLGLDKSSFMIRLWKMSFTFGMFCFGLLFYRADSLKDAVYILGQLPHGWRAAFSARGDMSAGFDLSWWTLSIGLIVFLLLMDLWQQNVPGTFIFAQRPVWLRWSYYYGLVLAIVFWGSYGQNPFLYFQF